MIDLKLLRADTALFKRAYELRGFDIDLDELLNLESEHRNLIGESEKLGAQRNEASKAVAAASGEDKKAAIAKAKAVSDSATEAQDRLTLATQDLHAVLARLPNLVHAESPPGRGVGSERKVRVVGSTERENALTHESVGEALEIIDTERAVKVSGARFAFLKRDGALLWLALQRYIFDKLAQHRFVPIIPPVLVGENAMFGTGFFPADETEVYKLEADNLYLAGTSEVALAAMHAGEVFSDAELPLRYCGTSSCFRREAGTYGKDTQGIVRLHQFEKVEMFVFCRAEESEDEHERLLGFEEMFLNDLEIPYRVIEIAAGDLAAPNYRKFDIEAWLPGTKRWLEVTSCSNDIDFQARRLNVRRKTEAGNQLVHTLNGTGLACQRTVAALIENHQRPDGGVDIPEALRPYTGFDVIKN